MSEEEPERGERRLGAGAPARDRDEGGGLGLPAERGGPLREPPRPRLEDLERGGEHRVERHLGFASREVEVERRRERGEGELVGAEGARERVPGAGADELRAAEEDPRLRAAERLVAGEADEVGAVVKRRRGDGLVGEPRLAEAARRARPGVVEERDARVAAEAGELGELDLLREADDPVVRRAHLQDGGGAGAERLGVVLGGCLVRRPDLEERRAASRQDRGDAKVAADRDELAARDGDGAPVRDGVESEEERRRRVRDGEGVDAGAPGGEELEEERPDVLAPLSAPSRLEVELERREAAGAEDRLARFGGEGRPAEVRVEEDPRRVHDRARARGRAARERRPGGVEERAGGVAARVERSAAESVRRLAERLARPEASVARGERATPPGGEERLEGGGEDGGSRQDP